MRAIDAPLASKMLPLLALTALTALTACPTVDLGDDPVDPGLCRPDPAYFRSNIWPKYLAPADVGKSCVRTGGCHAEVDGRSGLRLDNVEPIDLDRNYSVAIRFLNCGTPSASPLLTKPLAGSDPHGGGDVLTTTDPAVAVFQGWF